jgi:hypothetical protein
MHSVAVEPPAPVAAERWRIERERIQRDRAQVEADARAAEAQCGQQFAVAGCVKQVRAERRSKLQLLDRQRALIDDEQRRQRAADRLARIREKQEQQASDAAKPVVEVKTRKAHEAAEPAKPIRPPVDAESKAAAVEASEAQAAARAAAAQRRARAAEAHRRDVEQRNSERESKPSKAAKPLPVPPAASLPGS